MMHNKFLRLKKFNSRSETGPAFSSPAFSGPAFFYPGNLVPHFPVVSVALRSRCSLIFRSCIFSRPKKTGL